MADLRGYPRAPHPAGLPSEHLTLFARRALTGSSDDRDSLLKACWQYAYAVAIRFRRRHHGAEDSAQNAAIVVNSLLKLNPPDLDPESVGAFVRIVVLRGAHEIARRRLLEAKAIREVSAARSARCRP